MMGLRRGGERDELLEREELLLLLLRPLRGDLEKLLLLDLDMERLLLLDLLLERLLYLLLLLDLSSRW